MIAVEATCILLTVTGRIEEGGKGDGKGAGALPRPLLFPMR